MAAPTLRAVGATASYGGANSTIEKPTGTVEGDLMVAFLASDGPNTPTSWVTRIPSGWAIVQEDPSTGTFQYSGAVAYKVAGASEPSTYGFSFGSQMGCGLIISYQGVNTSSPINVSAQQTNSTSSTSHPLPSITTTVADCLVVGYYRHSNNNGSPYTQPSGWTERADFKGSASNSNFGVADNVFATAGATGTVNATGNTSDSTWVVTLAIAPAGGGGTNASDPGGTGTSTGSGSGGDATGGGGTNASDPGGTGTSTGSGSGGNATGGGSGTFTFDACENNTHSGALNSVAVNWAWHSGGNVGTGTTITNGSGTMTTSGMTVSGLPSGVGYGVIRTTDGTVVAYQEGSVS